VEGTTGWRGEQANLNDMAPDHVAFLQSMVRLHLANQLTESFPKLTLKGKESVQGREADVLEAAARQGQLFKLYFETKTGLLFRFTTEFQGASLRYDWDDYRDVEGVKLPYKLSAQEGPWSYTIRFTTIKRNTPIDDAKFKKPNQ
jgi:hypothetical protein